jgi:predicted unusual protein kinase regulating ubiquinone biosynthesis (AarF/ABC1/UbiB family)
MVLLIVRAHPPTSHFFDILPTTTTNCPIPLIPGPGTAAEELTWDYILWAITRLGPCFIKLAQWG